MKQTILLTGAFGLVGSEVLRRLLLWNDDSQIVLLLRSKGRQTVEERFNHFWNELFSDPAQAQSHRSRVQFLEAKLDAPQLNLSEEAYRVLLHSVTSIFHIAAEVRFDLPLEEARQANVESTKELFNLARAAVQLGLFQHFHHVSTFASARSLGGSLIPEEPPTPSETSKYRNTYEQTKAEAETFLLSRTQEVPLSIYRPSVICGDSRTGWTSKSDPFHLIFKLFLSEITEKVDQIPVPRDAKLDAVPIDFVADTLFLLAQDVRSRPSGSIFHLVAGENAIPLATGLQELSRHLLQSLKVNGIPIPKVPEFPEIENLDEASLSAFFGGSISIGQEVFHIFQKVLPYAFDTCIYDHKNLLEALKGSRVQPKSVLANFPSLVEYFVQTEWKKQAPTRPPLPPSPVQKKPREAIAIVGLGGILPQGKNVQEFWKNLVEGKDCISEIKKDRWDPEIFQTNCKLGGFIQDLPFEALRFRIPPLAAKTMDRLQKMVLLAAEEALLDAGYSSATLTPELAHQTGMILGYSGVQVENDYSFSSHPGWALLKAKLAEAEVPASILAELEEKMIGSTPPINEDTLAGSLANVAVGRVMSHFDLKGPSYVVSAGDVSALAAIDQAMDCLITRECDLVITGGAHALMDPTQWLGLTQEGLLSAEKPKPFSPSADGTVPGEGACLFVLKRLSDAIQDKNLIYGIIQGSGHAGNGKQTVVNHTSSGAMTQAIQQALEKAGSAPERLSHLEAHGSGVPLEDQNELKALKALFPKNLRLGFLKARIGHLAGASGAAALMKAALSLRHQVRVPEVCSDPDFPFSLQLASSAWDENRHDSLPHQYGISAGGSWGQAYHLILEEWNPSQFPSQLDFVPFEKTPLVPIAVIGMGATLPGSKDVTSFWENILSGKNWIREIPEAFWLGSKNAFYDKDPQALNKTYGTLGAFAPQVQIDSLSLGIPPRVQEKMDPVQLQFLAAATESILGSGQNIIPRDGLKRTSLVIGESKSGSLSNWKLILQTTLLKLGHYLPQETVQSVKERIIKDLGDIDEDSRTGTLFPVALSRLAKAHNIQGGHCAIDAACASSLAALSVAVRELRLKKQDCIIYGGVGVSVTPAANIPFARCQALSATGSHPFSQDADGIVLGEGSVVFVLKRLEDAEKNQDPIHAVIRGVGASSDGKGHSVMAPSTDGQTLALQRALAQAECTPESIQFVECHATGTPVGDESEVETVAAIYSHPSRKGPLQIGAVKSQIGHTVGAAGAAGLLKAVLGMNHRVFPPTFLKTSIHPRLKLEARGLRLNLVGEAWNPNPEAPFRRAGVSAFGFGGTNWHAIVEESPKPIPPKRTSDVSRAGPASSRKKKMAFLFPGHGSPYPDMGIHFYKKFPVFRAVFQEANHTLAPLLETSIEELIFTEHGATSEQIQANLRRTDWVQPILLTLDMAFYRLLRDLGLKADALLGHSVGEFAAAVGSGMLTFEQGLLTLFHRGRIFRDQQTLGVDTGRMVAVLCSPAQAVHLLKMTKSTSVVLANTNCPSQSVLSGPSMELHAAVEIFEKNGVDAIQLPIEVAWHSPLAHSLGEKAFRDVLSPLEIHTPRTLLLSNVTQDYCESPQKFREGLVNQLGSPMNFMACIEKLYDDGFQSFIEVGPRKILKTFVSETLKNKAHSIHSIDQEKFMNFEALRELLAEVKIAKPHLD